MWSTRCITKTIHDNRIKENVTVMPSNFSRNHGTITILAHFMDKHHSKLPIANKILIQWCFSLTLHLACVFEVIILPNKIVIALFHHFFLHFLYIAEISLKARNTRNLITPVSYISEILTTFNLYSGRARMGL